MPPAKKRTTGSTTGRAQRRPRSFRKVKDSLCFPLAQMSGADVIAARLALGKLWGLGRGLVQRELSAVILVPHSRIASWERARDRPIPAWYAVTLMMMLDGARPRGMEAELEL